MRLLQVISLIENVLGIYRSNLSFKKLSRILIYIRVIFEVFLIIVFVIHFTVHTKVSLSFLFLIILNTTNSIVIMLLAIYQGVSYKKLIVYRNSCFKYFPTHTEQAKRMEITHKASLFLFLSYGLLKLLVLLINYKWQDDSGVFLISNYTLPLLMYVCNIRFLFEFYVMCYGIKSVADQLALTIEAIELETGKGNVACEHNTIRTSQHCKKRLRLMDNWSAAYATIKKCSELYNTTFGVQVIREGFVTLIIVRSEILNSVVFGIILLYNLK